MIVDVNVHLSRWPSRRLPHDETPKLVNRLRHHRVTQAWAGTFDGLLHNDIAAANANLAAECKTHGQGLLLPFGAVNLSLPAWSDDVLRCHETHQMRGIRLYPNYHGYKLDAPEFAELLKMAAERKLIVQIAVSLEDERTQHRLLRAPPVDLKPLAERLKDFPSLHVVLLNSHRTAREDDLAPLTSNALVFVEIGTLEGVGGIARALKVIPVERILFGSHAPFFAVEAAMLKLQESELANFQREAILYRNANRLIATGG